MISMCIPEGARASVIVIMIIMQISTFKKTSQSKKAEVSINYRLISYKMKIKIKIKELNFYRKQKKNHIILIV